MKFNIVHDISGRIRFRAHHYAFSDEKALALECAISKRKYVHFVKVNPISGSILVEYDPSYRDELVSFILNFDYQSFDIVPYKDYIDSHQYDIIQRQTNVTYTHKIIGIILKRYSIKLLAPSFISKAITLYNSYHYIKEAWQIIKKLKIEVPILDAMSIVVSMMVGDFDTAGNIMMLLKISDLLQDYTKKTTTLQLEESLSLNIDKVWIKVNDEEVEIPMMDLSKEDIVIVQMGSMIPVDGEIIDGEGAINEASFTGEPLSKQVSKGDSVLAGTIVEEGKLYIKVRNLTKESRISKIIEMINTNESLKASIQANAEHLADSIVPFSILGFFGMYAYTKDLVRASSILLVDYSCAIKLTTSISIISAMQEASKHQVAVKGGKYLEGIALSDTIVFDKTGTLTHASPKVMKVTPVNGYNRDEVLKTAACLEEHFPHSVANAIVKQAEDEGLIHEEEHAKVDYIIAHGISTTLRGEKAIIGSSHFIFEDEHIEKTDEIKNIIDSLHNEGANSLIYLAIGGKLAGIISINDPLKKEAVSVIKNLRKVGFKNIIMMTGDSEHAARDIANQLDLDKYYAGVLPENKAQYIKELQDEGHTVVMVGDGVNDTPALSQADVSISLQEASDIARELADITLTSGNLEEIVELKVLSLNLISHIHKKYRQIVFFNTGLIILGALGILQPSTSALLHNSSTFLFAAQSTASKLK